MYPYWGWDPFLWGGLGFGYGFGPWGWDYGFFGPWW